MPIKLPEGGCLFCDRITAGRDDWAIIHEDEETVAVINPRQQEEGQALVIPRRHAPTILDLSEEEFAGLMGAVHRLSRALVDTFDPDGLTLYQNNGTASHQEVPHAHFHVVPRRFGSGFGEGPPHIAALRSASEATAGRASEPPERLRKVVERIRGAMA